MRDPIYRGSTAQEVIIIRVPIDTTTTIAAYGSGDNFTNPYTEFGTDETIMVAGTVVAADGADLSLSYVDIRVNGPSVGTAPLVYDPTTRTNYYQFTLGILAEGDYTVEARFRRLRV